MKKLLFLGDSITDCSHSFEPENLGFGYVRKISEALALDKTGYEIINKGNDGFTVSSVCRLWQNHCTGLFPDLITILVGINDLAVLKNTGITPMAALSDFRDRYENLISKIRAVTDCPILLMEPFLFPYPAEYITWEPELLEMNAIIRAIAQKHSLSFLPLWESLRSCALKEGLPKLTTDGIHLTPRGHQLIAHCWLKQFPTLLPR